MTTMFRHAEKKLICATTKVSKIFLVAEVSQGEPYRRWSESQKNPPIPVFKHHSVLDS